MTYDPKTYKKCNFVKLSKDPLKPLAKRPEKKRFNEDKSKLMAEWRDGWFKGEYERPNDKF